ncbi:MAG: right-handed parallel beta-helix repeat-containing protein [bacterium]|nr:right-handed parallel beta-helix repeat-containing protein [bacterium]
MAKYIQEYKHIDLSNLLYMNIHTYKVLKLVIILFIFLFFIPSNVTATTEVSGSISEDTTWTIENSPYVVNTNIVILAGNTLIIESGVVVKFEKGYSSLMVYGNLITQGTNTNKVYFTAYHDDSVGGDTNGDGGIYTPIAGQWGRIIINSGGTANMDNTVVRYGGYKPIGCSAWSCYGSLNNSGILNFTNSEISQNDRYGILQSEGVSNIDSSVISYAEEYGIYLLGGSMEISNSNITDNIDVGIYAKNDSALTLNNNTFENNGKDVYLMGNILFNHSNNISLSGTYRGFYMFSYAPPDGSVWTADNMPYIVNSVNIYPDRTLTVEAGAVIKVGGVFSIITVNGTLNVQGTKENKVYFTSYLDDSVGGDTNGDGDISTPSAGQWKRIIINSGGTANIDNAVVRYGGFRPIGCAVWGCYGAINNSGTLNLTNSEVYQNDRYGILQTEGISNIDSSIISENPRGIYLTAGNSNLTIHNSSIINNTEFGISNYSSNVVDAINNWWGDTTGPYHPSLNPSGVGNAVSNNVDFDPWLEQKPSTIDALIEMYEPILYFHEDERFFPMNIEAFVNNSSLWQLNGSHQLIKDENDINPVSLEDLTPEGQDTSNYYIQFSENLDDKQPDPVKAIEEYEALIGGDNAHNTYYAYRDEDSYVDEEGNTHEFIVLQYWYFYAFNNWKYHGGLNNHEGDWEVVMVFLDKNTEEPEYVAYSAHHNKSNISISGLSYDSVRRSWDSNEINKQDDNVISFVALGSHANYPNNGENGLHNVFYIYDDLTSIDGEKYLIDNWQERYILDSNNLSEWLINYEGKWGLDVLNDIKDGSSGPIGPYSRNDELSMFNDPIKWAGIDNIGEKTITEELVSAINFVTQGTKFVFDNILEVGTKVAVDLHNEVISFGENINDIVFYPYFWDIESSLENTTFGVNVSFEYNQEELSNLAINENNLAVFYYNEYENIWEKTFSTVDRSNSSISFLTNHFSRYAIGVEVWQDVSEDVKVVKMRQNYNQQTGIKTIKVKLKNNTKKNITGDLRLLITDIDKEGVEFVNPTGITKDGIPYLDIGQPYNQCIFVGNQEDIVETKDKQLEKILLNEKIMNKNMCERLIKKYPQLEDKLEYILSPNHYTEPIELKFSLLIKKTKIIENRKGEKTIYTPEFKNFNFDVGVLNKN